MNIIEKIQQRTRAEYIELLKLWSNQLSASIQSKPLPYFGAGVLGGMVVVMFSKLVWPLLLLVVCVGLVVYFIAPVSKIN